MVATNKLRELRVLSRSVGSAILGDPTFFRPIQALAARYGPTVDVSGAVAVQEKGGKPTAEALAATQVGGAANHGRQLRSSLTTTRQFEHARTDLGSLAIGLLPRGLGQSVTPR